jgi:hypothetical protein
MAEISVRVESRAEAEWLWSRLLGARILEGPLRVVLDAQPAPDARLAAVRDAIDRGVRQRMLHRAWVEPVNAA